MTRKNPERPTRTVKEIVEYNASMIHEVYESVMKLRRAVAILHDELIRDELEDLPEIPELEDLPDPELEEVARLHAEWDGKSPHPYGCDGGEGPDAGAVGFAAALISAAVRDRPDDLEGGGDKDPDPVATPPDAGEDLEGFCGVSSAFGPRPDAEVKKYVEPIRIAGKLELKIGMFDGRHNREFVLYTIPDEEVDTEQLIPFWTTKLKTEELIELKEAIVEALLTASRWDFE